MTKYEQDVANRIEQLIFEGKVKNEFLVYIVKLCIDYLQLTSIADYTKEIKQSRHYVDRTISNDKIIKINNIKYVINNE